MVEEVPVEDRRLPRVHRMHGGVLGLRAHVRGQDSPVDEKVQVEVLQRLPIMRQLALPMPSRPDTGWRKQARGAGGRSRLQAAPAPLPAAAIPAAPAQV